MNREEKFNEWINKGLYKGDGFSSASAKVAWYACWDLWESTLPNNDPALYELSQGRTNDNDYDGRY
jgi:hypothetical protein